MTPPMMEKADRRRIRACGNRKRQYIDGCRRRRRHCLLPRSIAQRRRLAFPSWRELGREFVRRRSAASFEHNPVRSREHSGRQTDRGRRSRRCKQ